MCDLYAEGKGLGRALMEYLDEREGELQEIDEGRNLPRFKVVSTAGEVQAEEAARAGRAGGAGRDPLLSQRSSALLGSAPEPGSRRRGLIESVHD